MTTDRLTERKACEIHKHWSFFSCHENSREERENPRRKRKKFLVP